ncbi:MULTISPECIES: tetratricopeptide repeat protein [Pseudidiomarina]|uniref:Regulator of sirC expression with transglutaminase-like and TPR domain n=2 Tax=Pseudidiomarina TaxID=2800384 RepID=A0A368V556_9GAMM|nr:MULTISPECIES: tetratricopeptide repeat protein [Pseudidiomarina]PWW15997.1 regulator of sirC expression with transglutaminase-like and TPR domain [Pseudidiomarina maritima]RBP93493.1 regulator of sirC expression with transglutaminase-like and TPR domain [Pseudidiomarina tainanensis]RCW35953.1 regulator of sirC expression with transglutaminase-like and TPR domain [Pseudidiomarina tainanensis]
MRFSYLEHIAQEILPTIEIIWEVSRAFHSDSDQYVADYYQSIRHLAEDLDELDGVEKLQGLTEQFFFNLSFSDAPEPIVGSQRILLDRVISYRTGLPMSLALLLQEAAAYAGLQLELVDFPGYPLLRFDYQQQSYFVDPINGDLLEGYQVQERFEDLTENVVDFGWDMFEAADQKTVLVRYLTELKHAFIHDRAFANALTTVHMLLTIHPDDPYEIRDRGYVLEELDCQQAAVDDYLYFVEQCPDDPSAQLLRLQLETWAAPQHILH